MLENLNSISFSPYGKVDNDGLNSAMKKSALNFIRQREITTKEITHLYVNHNGVTVIDAFSGSAVLVVGKSCIEFTSFWFDKTVIIDKGIYFCVMPLLFKTSVAISTKSDDLVALETVPPSITWEINPKIYIDKIYTIFYQEKERGFLFAGETHNFWELTYVDEGSMRNIVDGRDFFLNQGELILFSPNQKHSQESLPDLTVDFLTISFDMSYPEAAFLSNRIFTADNEIKNLLEKIIFENENQSLYSGDLILCYLKEALIKLIRCVKMEIILEKSDNVIKQHLECDIVERTKEFIRTNINKPLTVAKIAKSIPVSSSYLSTIFKKNASVGLGNYIIKEKLFKAKSLIRSGKYSISQISDMLSFSSVHYFTKVFKKYHNINPGEYSKSIKG